MSDQNQNPKLLESILYLEKDNKSLVITAEKVKVVVKEHQDLFDRLKDA